MLQVGLLTEASTGKETPPVDHSTVGSALSYVSTSLAAIQRKDWFRAVNKKLNLVPKSGSEQNFHNPTDMSYVFGGAYVPLTCR